MQASGWLLVLYGVAWVAVLAAWARSRRFAIAAGPVSALALFALFIRLPNVLYLISPTFLFPDLYGIAVAVTLFDAARRGGWRRAAWTAAVAVAVGLTIVSPPVRVIVREDEFVAVFVYALGVGWAFVSLARSL